ncbi:MAG: 7TM domain-containing protein [Candidatus Moraniibacteriota bacterium]
MHTNNLIDYFVSQGVPQESILLILMLPVVATLVAFFRQVVGIKAFGIYTPSIITFAFYAIAQEAGAKGIKYGIAIFISVILAGMGTRYILKKLRMLYLPRVAITLSVVAFVILSILVVGGYFQRTGLAAVSIFPLLIMITIVEKFVAAQIEKGSKTAFILAIETLFISLVTYAIISSRFLTIVILEYPWVVLLTVPFNIFLGKWTGLRMTEYWRFRDVLKKM